MSPPYPTATEIKAIFELENGPAGDREAFLSHVDDDFELKVVSDHHPFPRTANKEEWGHLMDMQQEWMDPDHPYERVFGVVTGGGDNEWAAVEITVHARTKAGHKYKADYLMLPKFNKEKKITNLRIYLDSHQFHTTKEHVVKGHLPAHPMSNREP